MSEKADAVEKGEGGEEEVGIDDEVPMTSFPPVEIEKDNGGHDDMDLPATRSSSSSGSDSSSGIFCTYFSYIEMEVTTCW